MSWNSELHLEKIKNGVRHTATPLFKLSITNPISWRQSLCSANKAEHIHMLIGAILPWINVASYLLQVQQVLGLRNSGCSMFIVWPMRLRTSWEFILLSLSASNSLETLNKNLYYKYMIFIYQIIRSKTIFLCTWYFMKIYFIIYLIYYLIFFNFWGKCY